MELVQIVNGLETGGAPDAGSKGCGTCSTERQESGSHTIVHGEVAAIFEVVAGGEQAMTSKEHRPRPMDARTEHW